MKHFITFQKKKALFVTPSTHTNESLVHQINHELMKYGFVMEQTLFTVLCTQSESTLQEVYSDLVRGIERVVGTDGYEPIYRNFPQSVVEMSYKEFLINAITHYWSFGTWRPEDAGYLEREYKIEPVKYTKVSLLDAAKFEAIFTNILYSGSSISGFDKECIDWYIDQGESFKFSRISFKETQAYVGKRLLDLASTKKLPTKSATTVLRIWAVYSGGDEGLKAKTKFKNPLKNGQV